MDVKGEINKVMEKLKKEGSIKSGLELDVSLSDAGMKCNDVETGWNLEDPAKKTVLAEVEQDDLADAFLCSNVRIIRLLLLCIGV